MKQFRALFILTLNLGMALTARSESAQVREKRLNNLVAELLEASSISGSGKSFTFNRSSEGWIFVAVSCRGKGSARVILDPATRRDQLISYQSETNSFSEAMRLVGKGEHTLEVQCQGDLVVERLIVKAI